MNWFRRLALSLAAAGVTTACNDQPLDATTERVSQLFIDRGCAETNCHTASGSPAGELDLETDLEQNVVGVPCSNVQADADGLLRVEPGDPDSSFLLLKLRLDRVDPSLGLPMPPAGEPFDDDELDLVQRWIETLSVDDDAG